MRFLATLVFLFVLAAGAAGYLIWQLKDIDNANIEAPQIAAPRIEHVRELSELVSVEMQISHLHTATISGDLLGLKTGEVKATFAVWGDVQILTDLEKAEYKKLDADKRLAVLAVPNPRVDNPRLDFERTRVVKYERGGLWKVLPSQRPERKVTNVGLQQAQGFLKDYAKSQSADYIEQAKAKTEKELRAFFEPMGWTIQFAWYAPKAKAETGEDAEAPADAETLKNK